MELLHKKFSVENILNDIDTTMSSSVDDIEVSPIAYGIDAITNEYEVASASVVCLKVNIQHSDDIAETLKMYRMLQKTIVSIFQDNDDCIDIIIEGDIFIGVFNTPMRRQVDEILETMAKLNALIDILSVKLKANSSPVTISGFVSADYGTVYLIDCSDAFKPIFLNAISDDFRFSETESHKPMRHIKFGTWHGKPFNRVRKYVENASDDDDPIIISGILKSNLKEEYKKYFKEQADNIALDCYSANLVNVEMKQWLVANKKKE